MPACSRKHATLRAVLVASALLSPALLAPPACGQGTSGPTVADSKVGYIDSALPGNAFRLRYDATYNNPRPNRAEFFYAPGPPFGPGLPLPERAVDSQDLSAYAEAALTDRLSAFAEMPVRFLNPEVNANTAGLADMNAGFKWAFLHEDAGTLAFQFRTYVPTGDADRGLGTRHVSLEPALLAYRPLTDRLRVEGEFRYWVPVGGGDFAGDVVRYGVGFSYDLFCRDNLRITPVAEFVGWTVLDGQASVVGPAGLVSVEDAAGDTIVNAKLGVRVWLGGRADLYAGYGRPLTGDRWYENTFRLELRLVY